MGGGGVQAQGEQVLREVHERVPLPRREAELPQRAHEEVRAGDQEQTQEGQEIQLREGVQARQKAGVRRLGEKEAPPCVRQGPEERVQLQARGDVRGRRKEVLLQG